MPPTKNSLKHLSIIITIWREYTPKKVTIFLDIPLPGPAFTLNPHTGETLTHLYAKQQHN